MSPSVLLAAFWLGAAVVQQPALARCPETVPATRGRVVNVASTDALERAIRDARPGDSIVIADGDYTLQRTLEVVTPGVVIRSRSGDPGKVVIHGRGMTNDTVGVGVGVNAPEVTVAGVTIRDLGFHAIQVRGERGASRFSLINSRLQDTGQQLLKVSLAASPVYADDGTVACSEFSYSDHAPSDYTNGVDVLGGRNWTIRDNRFLRIRGPQAGNWSAGPAILVWAAAEDTVVERNVVIDCFRGIAFGLAPGTASYRRNDERRYDHLRGVIRNNVVVNLNAWADEAIEANGARDARIEHNTVLVEGAAPWSIGVRFVSATAVVANNLTNRQVLLRNGGSATQSGNVTNATREWFVDPAGADVHLTGAGGAARRAGVLLTGTYTDFEGRPRYHPSTAGAYE